MALSPQHDTTKAVFDKLAQARSVLDKARTELGDLTKLGDLVTPEDVIKAAGKLVGAGLSPMALAKLLSDMPEHGPALSAWLGQHVADVAQREQQLDPVLGQVRHQLGVEGMKHLVGASLAPTMSEAPSPATAGGNPLSPNSGAQIQLPAGDQGDASGGPV